MSRRAIGNLWVACGLAGIVLVVTGATTAGGALWCLAGAGLATLVLIDIGEVRVKITPEQLRRIIDNKTDEQ